jgi:hypothetical protein
MANAMTSLTDIPTPTSAPQLIDAQAHLAKGNTAGYTSVLYFAALATNLLLGVLDPEGTTFSSTAFKRVQGDCSLAVVVSPQFKDAFDAAMRRAYDALITTSEFAKIVKDKIQTLLADARIPAAAKESLVGWGDSTGFFSIEFASPIKLDPETGNLILNLDLGGGSKRPLVQLVKYVMDNGVLTPRPKTFFTGTSRKAYHHVLGALITLKAKLSCDVEAKKILFTPMLDATSVASSATKNEDEASNPFLQMCQAAAGGGSVQPMLAPAAAAPNTASTTFVAPWAAVSAPAAPATEDQAAEADSENTDPSAPAQRAKRQRKQQ